MANYTSISSSPQLENLIHGNEYTLIDFWATWCPPCKAIAPLFERIAADNAAENKLAFAKVDVDATKDVAQQYKISAMPTFLLLRNGVVCKAVRGADVNAIKKMVTYAQKRSNGEKITDEEEEEFSQIEFGGGATGNPYLALLFAAFLIWFLFWRK
ncbi:thioredoxin-like protein [Karstenula rhodostoma CBS 690.94]|uniref:Thioredoxin-like protein n=1 Tax=Karstenula rhodostoma CBS 690.94 TaxID=1392251 RepID=A0A9P4U6H9_9PLEO|nr:thioredoxin-like protein [Karstenula rhodostoma CBS 690.94]